MLLTSDKALREVAEGLHVETHGTIWLVEQMIKFQKISTAIAEISFQHVKNSGSRLPWHEVSKMLERN